MPPRVSDFIRDMFSMASPTYEPINHLLTFGLDIRWRKRAARLAASAGGGRWADLCSGTGETAAWLARLAPDGTQVYAVDLTQSMLREAKKKPEARGISFIVSDIGALPFPDSCLDLIAMSFAARNINVGRAVLVQRFAEFHRVLKPGGRFVNLETSIPSSAPVRRLRDLYVKLFVESIGGRISGARAAYAYLAHTIPRFYPPEELACIMREAGFEGVSFEKLLFGAAAIHKGTKRKENS